MTVYLTVQCRAGNWILLINNKRKERDLSSQLAGLTVSPAIFKRQQAENLSDPGALFILVLQDHSTAYTLHTL